MEPSSGSTMPPRLLHAEADGNRTRLGALAPTPVLKSGWARPGRSRPGRPHPVHAGRTSSHILADSAVIGANLLRLLPVCCQIRCSPRIHHILGDLGAARAIEPATRGLGNRWRPFATQAQSAEGPPTSGW